MLAFAESLIVIGMFVPAVALMIAVGGLIAAGVLDPVPVLVCAITGSVLGDWVSYLLGRRIGPSIYRRWPLRNHRPAIARASVFPALWFLPSVFIGRFFADTQRSRWWSGSCNEIIAASRSPMCFLRSSGFQPCWHRATAGASLPLEMLGGWHAFGIGAALFIVPFLLAGIAARLIVKQRPRKDTRPGPNIHPRSGRPD